MREHGAEVPNCTNGSLVKGVNDVHTQAEVSRVRTLCVSLRTLCVSTKPKRRVLTGIRRGLGRSTECR